MLGAIIGDIVGSRFEFGPAPEEGFDLFTDDCSFTDDTVCTIAVADAVLNGKSYKDALVEWCQRYPDPKGGYGARFYDWIFVSVSVFTYCHKKKLSKGGGLLSFVSLLRMVTYLQWVKSRFESL